MTNNIENLGNTISTKITRRQFLKDAGAATFFTGLASFLEGCAMAPMTQQDYFATRPEPTIAKVATQKPTPEAPKPTSTPDNLTGKTGEKEIIWGSFYMGSAGISQAKELISVDNADEDLSEKVLYNAKSAGIRLDKNARALFAKIVDAENREANFVMVAQPSTENSKVGKLYVGFGVDEKRRLIPPKNNIPTVFLPMKQFEDSKTIKIGVYNMMDQLISPALFEIDKATNSVIFNPPPYKDINNIQLNTGIQANQAGNKVFAALMPDQSATETPVARNYIEDQKVIASYKQEIADADGIKIRNDDGKFVKLTAEKFTGESGKYLAVAYDAEENPIAYRMLDQKKKPGWYVLSDFSTKEGSKFGIEIYSQMFRGLSQDNKNASVEMYMTLSKGESDYSDGSVSIKDWEWSGNNKTEQAWQKLPANLKAANNGEAIINNIGYMVAGHVMKGDIFSNIENLRNKTNQGEDVVIDIYSPGKGGGVQKWHLQKGIIIQSVKNLSWSDNSLCVNNQGQLVIFAALGADNEYGGTKTPAFSGKLSHSLIIAFSNLFLNGKNASNISNWTPDYYFLRAIVFNAHDGSFPLHGWNLNYQP
jgi:hypothetical protein